MRFWFAPGSMGWDKIAAINALARGIVHAEDRDVLNFLSGTGVLSHVDRVQAMKNGRDQEEKIVRQYLASQTVGTTQQDPSMREAVARIEQNPRCFFAAAPGGTGDPSKYTPIAKPLEISLLASYFYFNGWTAKAIRARFPGIKVNLFVDSGGFSAETLGQHVRLTDYVNWLKKNLDGIDLYANLDAIGDPVKTARNQAILEAEGLNPVPVFHVGSDFKHLDAIIERGYPYIALGGMVPYLKRGKWLKTWCRQAFARFDGTKVKVHGFGIGVTMTIASAFPWASIDSSSWTTVFRYRLIWVFDERSGKGHAFYVGVDCNSKSKDVFKHGELLRTYGFSPGDFYPPKRYSYIKAGALSVMSALRAEAWLRENARKQGWSHGEDRGREAGVEDQDRVRAAQGDQARPAKPAISDGGAAPGHLPVDRRVRVRRPAHRPA